MTQLTAIMMHGERGGEGRYNFEIDEPFAEAPADRVVRAFMEWLCAKHPGEIAGYEVNAAMRSKRADVVTVIGELDFGGDNHQPFMCMISPARA